MIQQNLKSLRLKKEKKILVTGTSGQEEFIHYEDLYSALSRLLCRTTPDPCTAKKNSFKATVECAIMNPGEQSLCQRKSIPHGRANHRECKGLPRGSTGKWDKE